MNTPSNYIHNLRIVPHGTPVNLVSMEGIKLEIDAWTDGKMINSVDWIDGNTDFRLCTLIYDGKIYTYIRRSGETVLMFEREI